MAQYRSTKLSEIARSLWVNDKTADFETLVTPDIRMHGLEEAESVGVMDGLRFYRMAREQIYDIEVDIDQEISEGAWEAILGRVRAKEIGTDRKLDVRLSVMGRLEGDRVAELFVTIDFLKLFQQLDRLPSHTREMCLLRLPVAL